MKKKLFATLGALCLGVILCVSSVFAVNWWYSITANDSATTIKFGQKITLSTDATTGSADGVYQLSKVTFKPVTVTAPDWTDSSVTGGVTHDQTTMPTFNLVLNVVEMVQVGEEPATEQAIDAATLDFITVSVKVGENTTTGTLGGVVLEDIQTIQGDAANFVVTIILDFDDEISDTFAERTLAFQLEIVKVEPPVVEG